MEVIKKYLVCFLLSITLFVPTNYAMKSDGKGFKVSGVDSEKAILTLVKYLEGKKVTGKEILASLKSTEIAEETGLDKEFIEEVLCHLTQQPSKKNPIKQIIENLSDQTREQLKGALIGSSGTIIVWLLGHGFLHSAMELIEPSSFLTCIPLALALGYLAYKSYKIIHIPKSVQDLIYENGIPLFAWASKGVLKIFSQDTEK